MSKSHPKICVVIGRTRHKMMQVEIQEAVKRGATLIELRLDFLSKSPDFKRILEGKKMPMIATVRRREEGGRWSRSEEERLMLLRQAIVAGFDYVDLEHDVIEKVPRFKDTKRIVSYHHMRKVPDDLEDIFKKMQEQDADIIKIAVTANHPSDNLRVMKLLEKASKPTVAFCMGDLGFASRILGMRMGMPFTYGAFNRERGIAPGLPSFDELRKIYEPHRINGDTKVFGVVGDPIGHSLSPLIHNRAFHETDLNAIYVPFRVPRGELEDFLKQYDSIPVDGYSVTIPHKESVATLANCQKDEAVEMIGAANTLVREADGWHAYNTDAKAAVDSLRAFLRASSGDPTASIKHRVVLMLGAGGVARAIAHGLVQEGAALTVANRTPDRARRLADDAKCRMVDWPARNSVICEILINCTSVGMYPNMDASPVHTSFLKPGLTVFDTVYTPENTMLIKEARERDCKVLTGVDMFVRQAALQFELFHQSEAPFEVMDNVVRRALSPVALRDED